MRDCLISCLNVFFAFPPKLPSTVVPQAPRSTPATWLNLESKITYIGDVTVRKKGVRPLAQNMASENSVTALRHRAYRDAVIISIAAVGVFVVSAWYDVFGRVVTLIKAHETWQLDEVFTVSIFLLLAAFVFVLRRRNELIDQIQRRERAESEKAALVPALEKALQDIQTLSELLPVCAWCKRIRDDKGEWSQLDVFLQKHTSIGVTHGICPECAKGMQSRRA